MKYVDIENWKRKEHFEFFYKMDYPQYNICMDLDITNFLSFTQKEKLSFYYSMIYAVTRIANESENFRYRIRDGKVILHDVIHPSFTEMNDDVSDDLFKMVTVDLIEPIADFVEEARKESQDQKIYFDPKKLIGRDDLIYITCIPWISFTHLSHTISLKKDDAVPRISWGKYYNEGDKVLLPFSVQVHHALADGIHVGRYIERLQSYLDNIGMSQSVSDRRNMVVRPIEERDNKTIAALIRKVFDEFNAPKKDTVYDDPQTDMLFQAFTDSRTEYWVVESDNKILGGCGFYPTKGLPESCAEIVKFYLSDESRGKGTGSYLLNMIQDRAAKAGYTHLYIESFDEFKHAVALYEKNGFRHLNNRLGDSGHYATTIHMLKEL